MINHADITDEELRSEIRKGKILYCGNKHLKIYGLLSCNSGKGMKPQNRVFFSTEIEAVNHGFRPCAHCMNVKYKKWIFKDILTWQISLNAI